MSTSQLSANEKVTNYVLEQIRSKKLIEGSKLPTEIELSQLLSVGRNAVRESLKTLQFIELIQSTKGSGYKLTSSFDDCLRKVIQILFDMGNYTSNDIRNLREALEVKSLQLIQSSDGVSEADISLLNECIDRMAQKDSPSDYDLLFHRTIARISGNPLIYTVVDAIAKVSEHYILIPWDDISDEDVADLIECHKKIVESLEFPHDPQNRTDVITQHYNIADKIIARKQEAEKISLGDFMKNYESEEELLRVVGDLWRSKRKNQ